MSASHPKPTLSQLPFYPSPDLPHHVVHIISDLLSASECAYIISSHQNLVPANVTSGTVRSREIFEDHELAERLWQRIRGFYDVDGGGRVVDKDGEAWIIEELNPMFRLCFYEKGGKFSLHTDGRRLASLDSQSFMALNVYLNTVPMSAGGATRFLCSASEDGAVEGKVLAKSQPTIGTAAVFRDDVWHDGEEVKDGVKWLLRTDIMFRRERPFDMATFCTERGWEGEMDDEQREKQGRMALSLAEALEDAGDGMGAVRWYKIAFRAWPGLERSG